VARSAAGPTTYVVLGYLFLRPRSGYEIRTAFVRGPRLFWNVSPAQLYPELKRLEREGLIVGTDAARGARPKVVYRLTETGLAALQEWLRQPLGVAELRDEHLLKLFFADAVGRDDAVAVVRARRAALARELAALEALAAEYADAMRDAEHRLPWLTLEYGIDLKRWQIEWHARAEERLLSGDYARPR
jgi:PadR family transcriptional regulator AphA